MEYLTPEEIKNVLNTLNKKILKLNEIKVQLQEAHLYSYQDLNAYAEIEMIIDSIKVAIMNL